MAAQSPWVAVLAGLLCCSVLCGNHASGQQVRLAGGPDIRTGRLEVLHNDQWGIVCMTQTTRNLANLARVVCRQLGFPQPKTQRTPVGPIGTTPANASVPVWLGDPACEGYEPNVAACYARSPWGVATCTHQNDVYISCTSLPPNVTLVNGSDPYTGRVQIRVASLLNYACGAFFDMNDALVLCRQLNFGPPARVLAPGSLGTGVYFARYQRLLCSGSERTLEDCRNDDLLTSSFCPGELAAAIQCNAPVSMATSPTAGGGGVGGSGSGGATTTSWGSDGRSVALIIVVVLLALVLVAAVLLLLKMRRSQQQSKDEPTAQPSAAEEGRGAPAQSIAMVSVGSEPESSAGARPDRRPPRPPVPAKPGKAAEAADDNI